MPVAFLTTSGASMATRQGPSYAASAASISSSVEHRADVEQPRVGVDHGHAGGLACSPQARSIPT